MALLQSQQTSDVFQFFSQSLPYLKQKVYKSTLWVCDRGTSQPFSINLQETRTLVVMKIQLHQSRASLDLQITPEAVLVQGERLDPIEQQNGSEEALPAGHFQSLIPLPSSIRPQTAVAELNGTTLTLTMIKSFETQQMVKITVGDRGQQLPYALTISSLNS